MFDSAECAPYIAVWTPISAHFPAHHGTFPAHLGTIHLISALSQLITAHLPSLFVADSAAQYYTKRNAKDRN